MSKQIKVKDLVTEGRMIQEKFTKQNLNEGFVYRIWSKIVDAARSENMLLLPVGAGKAAAALTAMGAGWVVIPLLGAVAAAMGVDKLDDILRDYFRSKYFDKNMQPIVDELAKSIVNDGPIKQHMSNIKRITDDLKKADSELGGIRKWSRGAPKKREGLMQIRKKLDDELRGLSKKINTRLSVVMRATGATQKIKAALPTDKDSFAGDRWGDEQFYRQDVKDAVMKAIEPTSGDISVIQQDVSQMKESIQRKFGSLL